MARIRLARIALTKLQKAIFGTRRVALESESKKIASESLVLTLLLYGSECCQPKLENLSESHLGRWDGKFPRHGGPTVAPFWRLVGPGRIFLHSAAISNGKLPPNLNGPLMSPRGLHHPHHAQLAPRKRHGRQHANLNLQ
jgi:hypothetical protein